MLTSPALARSATCSQIIAVNRQLLADRAERLLVDSAINHATDRIVVAFARPTT